MYVVYHYNDEVVIPPPLAFNAHNTLSPPLNLTTAGPYSKDVGRVNRIEI